MDITVKSFFDLDAEERARLTELSPPDQPTRRELFRYWLRSPDPQGMYAALIRVDDVIVGWAGANMKEGALVGMIGVVVAPEYRGRGFARVAVRALLAELKRVFPDQPEFLYYQRGFEPLFGREIEAAGFKDRYSRESEYAEVYTARMRRIS